MSARRGVASGRALALTLAQCLLRSVQAVAVLPTPALLIVAVAAALPPSPPLALCERSRLRMAERHVLALAGEYDRNG